MTDNDRMLHEALIEDLAQRDVDDMGRLTDERRRRVARALVDLAIDGNIAAIREIFDRTEGRPIAASKSTLPPRRVVLQWAGDAELDDVGPEDVGPENVGPDNVVRCNVEAQA